MYWPHHMTGFGWGGWIIAGLVMLLFWGGLIALVFFTIRAFFGARQENGQAGSSETALGILKRRYAQGEIDETEYEDMRRHVET